MRVNPIYAVLTALILGLVGLSAYLSWSKDKVVAENAQLATSARKAVVAREALEAALVSTARRNAATARAGALSTHSLRQSVASSPEWASTPVPDTVQKALTYDIETTDSVPPDLSGSPSDSELAGL